MTLPVAPCPDPREIPVKGLVLIVVGAHLRAEMLDRPLGYRLRERMSGWNHDLAEHDRAGPGRPILETAVCTDLWFLNQPELLERPAVAVGAPGVNAATAHFANRLPVAFLMEETLEVRMDLEARPPAAALWGIDHATTASAVDLFVERYLDDFLRAANQLVR